MSRDLWTYAKAVVWRWASVATGVVVSLGLLLSQAFDVAIPRWVFADAAIVGILVAGFLAWRDERRKLAAQGDDELRELTSRMLEKYVAMAESHKDEGPHALAELNLAALGSDPLIRKTIRRMEHRVGRDPWEGWARFVEDVDLVKFFTLVRDLRVNLHGPNTNVEKIAAQVKAAGGHRLKEPNL